MSIELPYQPPEIPGLPPDTDALFIYHCTRGSGRTLLDSSGNGCDATCYPETASDFWETMAGTDRNVLVTNTELTILKDGRERFRGVISEVRRKKYLSEVTAKESAARLGDLEAGMHEVGGMSVPKLYLYHRELETVALPDDLTAHNRTLTAFEVRTEESLPGIARKEGYEKAFLFDSFNYAAGPYPLEGQRFRGMVQREESLNAIAGRIRALSDVQEGPQIKRQVIEIGGMREQMTQAVRDEQGTKIGLEWLANRQDPYAIWGLVTRAMDGITCSYLWISREPSLHWMKKIELYQLINHGIALKLGTLDVTMSDAWWVNWDRLHAPFAGDDYRIFGPFAIEPTTTAPWLLSFCWLGGQQEGGTFNTRAEIWEVDLRVARNLKADGTIPHRTFFTSKESEGSYARYVSCAGSGHYEITSQKKILRHMKSTRSAGEYRQIMGSMYIHWIGDLWLSEAACDFSNTKLSTVLRELSLVSGAEWWIEGGVLRLERSDRTVQAASTQAAAILEDETVDQAETTEYDDFSPSGIPLTEYHAALIKERLKALAREHQGKRRHLKFVPSAVPTLTLGAQLSFNGEKSGRIVAVEAEATSEKVELEL